MSKMPDTISVQIKLRGSEALYATPVSIRSWWIKDSKLHIYSTIEFFPKIPWELKQGEGGNKFHNLQLWYTRLTRAIKAFLEIFPDNIRKFTGRNVFHEYFKHWTWDWGGRYVNIELNNDWFYATDIFPYTLHINGNIEVDYKNSSEYIDWEGYLSPSSKWVEERLKEDFHCWGYQDQIKEIEEKFWKWRQEQIDKGYEVYYITSLET